MSFDDSTEMMLATATRHIDLEPTQANIELCDTPSTCAFVGCGKTITARGLCSGHYSQAQRGKPLAPLRGQQPVAACDLCEAPDCGRKAITHGLCGAHLTQKNKGLELTALVVRALPSLPEIAGVEFRHCPGYIGYAADSNGNIWGCFNRFRKSDGAPLFRDWRVRIASPDTGGYLTLVLHGETRTVHQLVLESFVGPRLVGTEACHNNGKRDDNRPHNLRWDTRSENQKDACKHGTNACGLTGEMHLSTKFTDAQIIEIREFASYNTAQATANKFGLSKAHVLNIRHGRFRAEAV